MNAKTSALVICVEAIIYLLHNLHDCAFKFFSLPGTGTRRVITNLILIKNREITLRNIKITQHKHTKTIL